jgi:hypothetical protein
MSLWLFASKKKVPQSVAAFAGIFHRLRFPTKSFPEDQPNLPCNDARLELEAVLNLYNTPASQLRVRIYACQSVQAKVRRHD